jgi:flavin reductase (DIM6/NTAB) family NADH-FMN oxidoreductase RutF
MHDHLMSAGRFAVNILASGQEDIARHFGGSPIEGLEPRIVSVGGIPTLSDACAMLTAHCAAMHDCGDHTLFIGHIQFVAADDRLPLVYHAGRYASLVAMRDVGAPILEFW